METALGAKIPSPEASIAKGKGERESVPRTSHADLVDRPSTFDPVQILIDQGQGRVEELLPVRYGRMAADEFSFLRGAAAVMAADIALGPSTDLTVQLCGDAHLSNFGVFFSPERRLVFDINDFDETHLGPFEWDVKRLGASIAVAGQSLNLTNGQMERAVFAAVQSYRNSMRLFSIAPTLDVWYAHLELEETLQLLGRNLSDEAERRTQNMMAKARNKGSRKAYSKLVEETPDGPRIMSDPPLLVPLKDLAPEAAINIHEFLKAQLKNYEKTLPVDRRHLLHEFTPIDAARKVVGVGSVGTRCFVLLLLGRDGDDPFFLQIKEANASVLENFLGKSKFKTAGERVVAGQQLTQATPDPFLGWFEAPDATGIERHFYVRQLYDGKASAEIATFDAALLRAYSSICGWTLAHAHARSGDRAAIASYLGKSDAFDRSIASFSLAYVSRNRTDHAALVAAIASGRVAAAAP
jgi:uncharacterized protein (DUF2252 family)